MAPAAYDDRPERRIGTRLGEVFDTEQPATRPLYRCDVPELGRWGSIDSTDVNCEGRVNPTLVAVNLELLAHLHSISVRV